MAVESKESEKSFEIEPPVFQYRVIMRVINEDNLTEEEVDVYDTQEEANRTVFEMYCTTYSIVNGLFEERLSELTDELTVERRIIQECIEENTRLYNAWREVGENNINEFICPVIRLGRNSETGLPVFLRPFYTVRTIKQ